MTEQELIELIPSNSKRVATTIMTRLNGGVWQLSPNWDNYSTGLKRDIIAIAYVEYLDKPYILQSRDERENE